MSTNLPSPVPVSITPVRSIVGLSTTGSTTGSPTFIQGVGGGPSAFKVESALQSTTIIADAVVEENHDDEAVITEQPVEVGSVVTDHMYKLPAKLELIYAWSEGSPQNATRDISFLKNIYQQLLGFQVGRFLCTVNTGKRIYQNMVVQRIIEKTDNQNENSLTVRLSMQEILFAETQIVPVVSSASQAIPQKTAPVVNKGAVSLGVGTSSFNGGGSPP